MASTAAGAGGRPSVTVGSGDGGFTTGWMKKKGNRSNGFKNTKISLTNTSLRYWKHEDGPAKEIHLSNAIIQDSTVGGEHGFSIKPAGSNRVHYFVAHSSEEKAHWLNAICEVQMSGKDARGQAGGAASCTVQ